MPVGHVQRNGYRHQGAGTQHDGHAEPPSAGRQHGENQHQHAQAGSGMTMHLLLPRLVHLDRPVEAGIGPVDLFIVTGPGGLTVTGRPVGAAQPGVGKPDKGAEHDHHEGQQQGGPGDAMEVAVRCDHREVPEGGVT